MEVPDMEEGKKDETHLTSASAFVEGGIQDSCDDACSICLEEFCESDPSTVTSCKHEFHLQCILEWCQRSSLCPMCLQPISLKDPISQELLEAVERERNTKAVPTRNATIFRHPTLGDFELQHLPIGVSNAELEERIIQHLAAAAAMGRTRHFGRREGQRNRTSSHGRPHFLVFSTHPGASPSNQVSSSLTHDREDNRPASVTVAAPSSSLTSRGNEHSQQMLGFPPVLTGQNSSASESAVMPGNLHGISFNNSSSQSSLQNHDRAGPSELQSFSESLKSRLNAVSMRYKESILRSTRGWKERFFSRNNSLSDLRSEVRREVSASVSHMIEHLEARDNTGANQATASTQSTDSAANESSGQTDSDYGRESLPNEIRMAVPCAPRSAST